MPYPSKREFREYFASMPAWVVPLIIFMLFGRFVLIAIWHWMD